jgi:hypothetical protein
MEELEELERRYKLLQNAIDRCVKHDCNVLKGELRQIMFYLKGGHRLDYLKDEIRRAAEEVKSMGRRVPFLASHAFDWKKPNFIWDTAYIEDYSLEIRRKYVAFPYESFDDRLYFENPTVYDESIPYFSIIVRYVVYCKYLEDLQNEERERLYTQSITHTVAVSKEKVTRGKIAGKENPFHCMLDEDDICLLTSCANEACIFTTEVTPQILENFFYCRVSSEKLQSNNNRLLAYFMTQLSICKCITYEWQSVISNNRLVFAPRKEGFLNDDDLSTANNQMYGSPKQSEIIDKYIEQLKKH